jgi:hypothetical protein
VTDFSNSICGPNSAVADFIISICGPSSRDLPCFRCSRLATYASCPHINGRPASALQAAAFTAFTYGTGIVLACCAAVALLAIAAVAAIPGRTRPGEDQTPGGSQ